MINQQINDHHKVKDWEEWKSQKYKPADDYGRLNENQSVYGPGSFDPADADAPLFSETTLYHIFGKEAARIILARWNCIRRELGIFDE